MVEYYNMHIMQADARNTHKHTLDTSSMSIWYCWKMCKEIKESCRCYRICDAASSEQRTGSTSLAWTSATGARHATRHAMPRFETKRMVIYTSVVDARPRWVFAIVLARARVCCYVCVGSKQPDNVLIRLIACLGLNAYSIPRTAYGTNSHL